uniref:ATP-binding protein n=1 Tax=Thaumasiovibrio occultus TaxID=1891184 RepID=UPI000B3558FC|nr:ATP-binding protein [Thaumasiovibrio occultus]
MNPTAIVIFSANHSVTSEVLSSLDYLQPHFILSAAQNVEGVKENIHHLNQQNVEIGLFIIDASTDDAFDIMTYLTKFNRLQLVRTILIGRQFTAQQLTLAINTANLEHCVTLPIEPDSFRSAITKTLTDFVLQQPDIDWLQYRDVLDARRIQKAQLGRHLAQYKSSFLSDTHSLNDKLLADQVISELYDFFDTNDETQACRTYSEGHILTREGEPNEFLWFIADGEVALYKLDSQGQQHEVIRHTNGSLIGGMSFVSGDPSFSTGIAQCTTRVIKLDRELFNKVMNSRTELLPLFTHLLLRHFNRRIKNAIRTEMRLQSAIQELEAASTQLVEKEKMAMLGQLVAGVAHELNNPVAAILRGSETLQSLISDVTNSTLSPINQQRGHEILRYAMASRPLSTHDIRQRAKALEPFAGDRNNARKMVQMGLDESPRFEEWVKPQQKQLPVLLQEWEHYHQVGSFLRSINVCAKRIADMVKSLKSYARQDDESTQVTNIHEGIEDTLVIFENRLKHHELIKEYSDLPDIHCRPIALQQVWTNVIANALDAMPQRGTITVSTALTQINHQTFAEIRVKDSGTGIEPDVINKIFELNFTTKRDGNFGLGIGLSVCQQIIRQHQGDIVMQSTLGEGTTVIITLPVATQNEERSYE